MIYSTAKDISNRLLKLFAFHLLNVLHKSIVFVGLYTINISIVVEMKVNITFILYLILKIFMILEQFVSSITYFNGLLR